MLNTLLKLRTPACVFVGALCVVLSLFEPVRFVIWDMVIAAVTGAACIALFMSKRRAPAVTPEPQDDCENEYDYDYDDYGDAGEEA